MLNNQLVVESTTRHYTNRGAQTHYILKSVPEQLTFEQVKELHQILSGIVGVPTPKPTEPAEQGSYLMAAAPKMSRRKKPVLSWSATHVAKKFGMNVVVFNKTLEKLGIQYKNGIYWRLRPIYTGRNFATAKVKAVLDKDDRLVYQQEESIRWTKTGIKFLKQVLERDGKLAS